MFTDISKASSPTESLPTASTTLTITTLLERHTRPGPPISQAFLQTRRGTRAPGPLHRFVLGRQLFALRLYLLLHCLALAEPWDSTRPAGLYARALGKPNPGGEATTSRSWHWLADQRLVRTERHKRMVRAYLLDERGTGEPYTRSRDFFTLPYAFFREGHYLDLALPGTAVLLIALNLTRNKNKPEEFVLPLEHAAGWYGISADTLQRGLDELQELQLLRVDPRWEILPLSARGGGYVRYYELLGPYSRAERFPGKAAS